MNFNELCKQSRWSSSELAKELNVDYQTVYAWRTGRREPRSAQITPLAKLLGTTEAAVLSAIKEQQNGI